MVFVAKLGLSVDIRLFYLRKSKIISYFCIAKV